MNQVPPDCICSEGEVSALRAEVHDAIGNRNLADDQFKVRARAAKCEVCLQPCTTTTVLE